MGTAKAVAELFEGRHFDREVIIIYRPVEGLTLDPSNPRRHSKKQRKTSGSPHGAGAPQARAWRQWPR